MINADGSDKQVQKILRDAGVTTETMDPASLEALRKYVLRKQSSDFESAGPPISTVEEKAGIDRAISDLTEPFRPTDTAPEVASESTDAGSSQQHSHTQSEVLLQLQRQTRMIIQLQKKVDQLAYEVNEMRSGRSASDGHNEPRRVPQQQAARRRAQEPIPRVAVMEEPQAPQPNRENHEGDNAHFFSFFDTLLRVPQHIANSRYGKIISLFLKLRRREVPNFDAGLLVKVLIMVAILTTRMSRRRMDNQTWFYKFYGTMVFVALGVLYQTKYLHFLYKFFVKENYPARIWNGEDIDADAVAARPVPQRRAPGPIPRVRGWRETIFAGAIAPPMEQNAISRFFQDVTCLVGSFFLSIFPMWQPEALGEFMEEEQHLEQPIVPEPRPDEFGQLPQVRPPRDPVEAADDDSDED